MITKRQRKSSRKRNLRSKGHRSQGVFFLDPRDADKEQQRVISNRQGRRERMAWLRRTKTNDIRDQQIWNRKVRIKRLNRSMNKLRREMRRAFRRLMA